MTSLQLLAVRIVLGIIAVGCVGIQVILLPELVRETAESDPWALRFAIPYAWAAALAVACLEVGLVAVWVLLGKVRRGAIFSTNSFTWVNAIIIAASIATAIIAGVLVWHLGVEGQGPPGLILMMGSAAVGGTAFVLLMLVMRRLLEQATALQSELNEVV